ncbi:hypothetical protein [Paenibacillus beijingensis]|uniref:hypothetical protein n=1 Tax=Paenibacillus beijingensis TaxID=1126833 RepID=UPI000A8E9126|nr:hypothetical protein [Paenibacillus beijingensis]
MLKPDALSKEKQAQEDNHKFSEVNELGHERNEVAKAQKEMASQETAGVFDQE